MVSSSRSVADLETYLATKKLSWETCQLPDKTKFDQTFPIRIPIHYANLIDWRNPDDPLRKMVIMDIKESEVQTYELADPIGDHNREAVPGLIHRYPDRCLLLLTSYCLVHCRFCFRKEVVGKVRPVAFKEMVQYLELHPEVQELIFSGGDPATMPAGFIDTVNQHFSHLKHVQRYRFHTRVPAVDPKSVSDEWLNAVSNLPNSKKIIVIHINHVRELSPETKNLIQKFLDRKFLVLSQSVLLKDVNNTTHDLTHLFTELVNAGVKPYYLYHLDKAKGTHHFRVSIEEGKKLFQTLRGNVSSLCLPEYVLDVPGGYGKIPVMWLQKTAPHTYQATNFEKQVITYLDPATASL